MYSFLTNCTYGMLQKERDELLNATVEDVRKLADYIDAFLSDDAICVVGNEEKIKEQKNLFESVTPLIR